MIPSAVQDAFHLVERPGAFNLCYDKWLPPRLLLPRGLPRCLRGLDETIDLPHRFLFHCKSETVVIPVGECCDAQVYARKVKPFPGGSSPPTSTLH
jgi:hypothetical protein